MQRGAKRNREAKSKKKKSIAIDMQHCIKTVTAQREKREAWREGWRGYFTGVETFQRQRKTGDWKRRDVGERRVMIERIDLFDRCREIERDGATRGR